MRKRQREKEKELTSMDEVDIVVKEAECRKKLLDDWLDQVKRKRGISILLDNIKNGGTEGLKDQDEAL